MKLLEGVAYGGYSLGFAGSPKNRQVLALGHSCSKVDLSLGR